MMAYTVNREKKKALSTNLTLFRMLQTKGVASRIGNVEK